MLFIKTRPYLILLLLYISNLHGYVINILNLDQTPDCLKNFTITTDEKGAVLTYKGDDNDNYRLMVSYPNYEPTTIVIPKDSNKDLPIYTICPKKNKKTLYGQVTAHNDSIQAYHRKDIENFKKVIPAERVIKLPEETSDNQNCFCSDDFFSDNSEPTSVTKPPYNFWKDVLMASGIVTTAALGFYYLTRNIEACARYLAGVERWSQWKSNEPIESILIIKPEYLAKELIKDIKTTYYEEPNPIALFLQDLEEEYETILQWIQFRNRIRFFGLIGTQFDFMEQRLALLDHLRQAAHHWRAREMETKMAHSSM